MLQGQEENGMKEWRLITKRTISEETSRIDITTDDDGKPFSCNELMIAVKLKADKDGVVPTCSVYRESVYGFICKIRIYLV